MQQPTTALVPTFAPLMNQVKDIYTCLCMRVKLCN